MFGEEGASNLGKYCGGETMLSPPPPAI